MPSPYALLSPTVYLGSFDATAYLNKLAVEVNPSYVDTTTFASAGWHQRTASLKDFKVTTSGFADHTNQAIEQHMYSRIGTNSRVLTVSQTDGSDGAPALLMNAIQGNFGLFGQVGDAGPISLDYGASGLFARGLILAPALSRTTSSTGTVQNLGASTGKTIYAALHVFPAVGGTTPTLDVSVKSGSTSGLGSPTTRISFAQQNTASAVFATATSSGTDAFYRVDWTIGGSGGPTFNFAVAVAVQ